MSDQDVLASIPSPRSDSFPNSDNSEEGETEHSLMYRSLESCLQHPDIVSSDWIDTIADFKNNPRLLSKPPYNDNSLHWVDRNDNVLSMAFPAVLNNPGKYGKMGPYFNLMSEQGVKVSHILSFLFHCYIKKNF